MSNRRPLVVGIVSFVIAALVLVMMVMPKRSKISELQTQIAEANNQTSQLQTQVSVLRDAKQQAPKIAKQLAELNAEIPESADLPSLLRKLERQANRAGVELEGIAPNIPTAAGPYSTIPVEVRIQGSYFAVEEYLYKLESIARATKVTSVTFAPGSVLPQLQVTVSTQFFTLDTSSGPGSAPGPQSVTG